MAHLAPKQCRCLFHPLGNFHTERASALAGVAADAGRGGLFQQSSMLMPRADAYSISATPSSSGWRSNHSPPKPISLTCKPVLPNLRVCIVCLLIFALLRFFICFYALVSMAWTSSTTNSWVGTGMLWRRPAATTAPLMTSTSVRRPAFRSA